MKTTTTYYVREIRGRWEVWSRVEYVEKTAWRQLPFHNFVRECASFDEANDWVETMNRIKK